MATPSPALLIAPSANGISLSWPQWAGLKTLYSTTSLVEPIWTQVTATPQNSGDTFTITLPQTNVMQFYRIQTQ